jgi:hypothetical protein
MRSVQMVDTVLAGRSGGEVRTRYLDVEAPELAGYAEARVRLADPAVKLPLVLVDGRVVVEGCVSAGMIMAYLADGQIPKVPEGHMVSGVPPAQAGPTSPEGGIWRCVGRWWRRLWGSSSS